MDTVKLSANAGKSGGAEQASIQTKDVRARERINTRMVQNVCVVWLDNNIIDNSVDCRSTITQLRRAINSVNTFTDGNQCIQFLESMVNEKACMIISGSLGQDFVPRVHNMFQVVSIFIFCDNKRSHEQWTKEWPKIMGVFTEFLPICEALKQAAKQYERNSTSISLLATNDDEFKKNLDQLETTFMYTQILKEILLIIKFEEKHFMEFIDYCRDAWADNESQLKNIDKLQKNYHDETPIWWYTYDSCLYSMLNRALRIMDVDHILKLGFFIADLHRHIEQLHMEQFGDRNSVEGLTLYRGQGMWKTEFEQLKKTKGGLISFNNFLSTSEDHDVAFLFADSNQSNPELVGVLFVMTIDPSLSSAPFASIKRHSYFQIEDEVLFAMHTVFRIFDIKPLYQNQRLFQVELTLTSDNDKDLRVLTDRIREETFPDHPAWYRLGKLLLAMGQSKKAEQVYKILLEQAIDESKAASMYRLIGCAKNNEGEYKEAITFYEKSIEIHKKTLPPNYPDLADSYNNVGFVYYNMGEDAKALSFHKKALEIRQQSLSPNHPDLAMSYNNIGLVYDNMVEDSKALSFHEKALQIRQISLPQNHPYLGASYGNIGLVYYNMAEYSKALSFHEKALEIQQQSLPPNHPDLAKSYNNIGNVYFMIDNYSKALSFYERAVAIGEQSLPSNHLHLQTYRTNTNIVKKKL